MPSTFRDLSFSLINNMHTSLARERPDQIIAVFIRDADESSNVPIRDPTGWEMAGAGKAGMRLDNEPLLDYDYTSPPTFEPRPEFTRNRSDGGPQQEVTPRAKKPQVFPGEKQNIQFRTDVQVFDEDPVETPTPKSVPLFESPTITPLNSSFLGPPKPTAATTPGIITKPPPPIHPLRLPASLSSFSSSSPTLIPSSLRQDSIDKPRTVKATSDPPQVTITTTTTNGLVNDERSRISTNTRTPHRNNTVGPTSSPSRPLSYIKSPSRFSFHGFGVEGHRRIVSGSSVASHNGSIGSSGGKSSSSSTSSLPAYNGGGSGGSGTSAEGEKKRGELQMRVCTARTQMPGKVVLRVFRSPEECREDVERILGGEEEDV